MTTRDEWVSRAATILDEIRALLTPLGIAVSTDLRIVADTHPCPGYMHDTRTIGFCPPVVETPVDRLRWTFFTKAMGCGSLDEVRAFYEVALPFIVAHETSHHLRTSLGLESQSHFVEEQACDKLAAAIVLAIPRHATTLGPLRTQCATMRLALAKVFANGPTQAFLPDVTDVAAHDDETRERLDELRRITAREGLSYSALALLVPSFDANELREAELARSEARRHLDLHYARDPSEYWYASVVWLERYLATPARHSLAEVLNLHLLGTAGTDAETVYALLDALRGTDAVVAEGAALTLLTRFGASVVHDLVDEAELEGSHGGAIVRSLASRWDPAWDPSAARRLLDAHESLCGDEAGRRVDLVDLLRLTLRAELDPNPLLTLARATSTSLLGATSVATLACTLTAIEGEDQEAISRLCHPHHGEAMANALDATRRKLPYVDAAFVASLPPRGTQHWETLTRALEPNVENLSGTLRAAALAADLSGREPASCAEVTALARESLAAVHGAQFLRARLDDTEASSFAHAVLEETRRLTLLDVIMALTPRKNRVAKAALLPTIERPGALPAVIVDLLVGDLADAELGALLRSDSPVAARLPGSVTALALRLSPIAREALFRALPDAFPTTTEARSMATLLDKILHLRRVALFATLGAERLAELAELTIERRFAEGELIVRSGDPGDELYVLVEGEVRLTRQNNGDTLVLATLAPPSLFGEMTLFDTQPRSADAIAVTACRLLSIDGKAVRQVGRRHPELYERLLALLSQRLRTTNAHLHG